MEVAAIFICSYRESIWVDIRSRIISEDIRSFVIVFLIEVLENSRQTIRASVRKRMPTLRKSFVLNGILRILNGFMADSPFCFLNYIELWKELTEEKVGK